MTGSSRFFVIFLMCGMLEGMAQNDSMFINKAARGRASFYAAKFDGRKTSNGEIFSNKNLTAAHRKFPMGSIVRVTVVENKRYVFVRINDRGPYSKGRIIDLTHAGTHGLDFRHAGTEHVSVRLMEEIQLTPELRNRFNSKKILHDCLGNTTAIKGKAVIAGTFLSLEHALYIGCDLYMDNLLNDIAIKRIDYNGNIRYQVIIHNFQSSQIKSIIPILYDRGLVNAKKYLSK